MDTRALHEDNRRAWSEAAEVYAADSDATVAFLRAGGQNFCASERWFIDGLSAWCRRAIHLQCAGGKDTLSLRNAGVDEVIGLDISDRMIEVARARGEALGANARWIRCDVLDAPAELNGTADLVYTGRGAIGWLFDLDAWAAVVARLLRPGGKLFLFEGHPITFLFSPESEGLELDPEPPYGDYFSEGIGTSQGWPSTYVGNVLAAEQTSLKHERQWTLAQVVNAVIGAGLVVEHLGEYPEVFWDIYPKWPADLVRRIPQTFSLLAGKPPA